MTGWMLVFITAALFTFQAFLVRLAMQKGISAEGLNFSIYTSAAVMSFVLCAATGNLSFSREILLFGLAGGVLSGVGNIFFTRAIGLGNYGLTVAFFSSCFLIPASYAVIRLGEKAALEGLALIVISVFLISLSGSSAKENEKQGKPANALKKWLLLMLTAFIFSGSAQIFQAESAVLPGPSEGLKYIFLSAFFGAVYCGFSVIKNKAVLNLKSVAPGTLCGLLGASGVFTTIEACKRLPANMVFPVFESTYIIAGVVISLFFFKEKISLRGFAGILLGIAGILLVSLKLTIF